MQAIEGPKGFSDILPADAWKWQRVEACARAVSALYNFAEIRTPVLEHTELFHRGVGDSSDVVHKETYTFTDRGNRSVTLRPEGTAGVVRALIEHRAIAQEGARCKVYYVGANFRYERPQAGRLRQHHQFGAESFGTADAAADAECILLQMHFYAACGLKGLKLMLNSLGDAESKQRYRQVIVDHLTPRSAQLSPDSQRRLSENPLRILDSKVPDDIALCADIPAPRHSLSDASRAHFDRVAELLAGAVDFEINPRLVRGFDYYTETLWEVTAEGLGAQSAIGGGGRYNNLVEQLGGRPTPGVGFGSGIERLLLALEAQKVALPRPATRVFWLVAHGSAAQRHNWLLLRDLRAAGVTADMDFAGRSVKAQFTLAERNGATHCIVVGDDEIAAGTVTVKDLAARTQSTQSRAGLIDYLRASAATAP